MIDRIERIAGIKGIAKGIDRFFKRREGYDDTRRDRKQFSRMLSHEMKDRNSGEEPADSELTEAYRLDLSVRPTQSLFYEEKPDLREAERKTHDAG